jgi:20S proteasome alpha/beta subunit
MTYVLGMKCTDGLVLCADSMEGDSVNKRFIQKLHVAGSDGQWGFCWGCAGSGDVIRKFDSAVKGSLERIAAYDKEQIEEQVEACLKHAKESYSPEHRVYVVAGLYGLSRDGVPEHWLYRGYSDSTCLAPEKEFAAVGMDLTVSDFFLENTYHAFAHVDYCQRIGIVATALMKRHAEGVDGATNVFSYRINSRKWEPLLDHEVSAIEGQFPLSGLDEAVRRFWTAHSGNAHVFSEMESAQIAKLLASQKSEQAQ